MAIQEHEECTLRAISGAVSSSGSDRSASECIKWTRIQASPRKCNLDNTQIYKETMYTSHKNILNKNKPVLSRVHTSGQAEAIELPLLCSERLLSKRPTDPQAWVCPLLSDKCYELFCLQPCNINEKQVNWALTVHKYQPWFQAKLRLEQ